MYVVIQQGVYMQGICGISCDSQEARHMAEMWARDDVDSYHSYDVYQITGMLSPMQDSSSKYRRTPDMGKIIYSVRKGEVK